MRIAFQFIFTTCFLILIHLPKSSFGQKGEQLDIKKPKELDSRVLRSEKSDQGKFSLSKRFFQNGFTHYNYFFNANTKLNEIVESAKSAHKDDYSELLSFYNFSLDETLRDKEQLDSVIYKSSTGIVLHDLRNDWIDNLYLLWGISYYLQKEFDSAYYTFQYINYSFAEKEKDGYYKYIGSRMDGNNALSIATKEKTNLPKKIFSQPPSRNDAFIWMIRTNLERNAFAEAAGLIETLRKDPAFPKRLKPDLYEMQALWFYKNNIWDSAAHYLSKAVLNADSKKEKARWEFLTAQLFEKAGNYAESENYFVRSVNHTLDPIMDIYGRLNLIRVNKIDGKNNIDRNISSLLKMVQRDKYKDYRDIIYYMAAQMELERNNIDAAMNMLTNSIKYDNGDISARNKAFLQLGEFAFAKKQYRAAANFYDSLNTSDPALKNPERINDRKEFLSKIAFNIEVIERQDSLIHIASLTEDERKDFIKKLVKQIRQQRGLKDEEQKMTTDFSLQPNNNTADLFSSNQAKGEWYFYNTSLRAKGVADFKTRWGNRPNVDNWRRARAISTQNNKVWDNTFTDATKPQSTPETSDISYESLLNGLPLTAEKIKFVEDSIQNAMFDLGILYADAVEDCEAMISTFEELRNRFPSFVQMDKVLFKLYYCYNKLGKQPEASKIKKELSEKHANSNYTMIITTGKNPEISGLEKQVTLLYESIYQLFIEGKFDEAIAKKADADKIYKNNYWTPQLLYIEAVYYIQQRQDEKAKLSLTEIIATHTGTVMAVKASNLLEVLSRRNEIEEELKNLSITRPVEKTAPVIPDTVKTFVPSKIQVIEKKPEQKQVVDNLSKKQAEPVTVTSFKNEPQSGHIVLIVLNKVDRVFQNEARNAYIRFNREKFNAIPLQLNLEDLDKENRLITIVGFKNDDAAMNYLNSTKALSATEITPWLNKEKYEFLIISQKNLEILKSNPELSVYKNFLRQIYPGKF